MVGKARDSETQIAPHLLKEHDASSQRHPTPCIENSNAKMSQAIGPYKPPDESQPKGAGGGVGEAGPHSHSRFKHSEFGGILVTTRASEYV